ncbi:SPFH domain-containing protein [Gammaproteobacteria bacterium]|nr:SPFH domain-containing protein [Gammaproteobacteria bacterium]
MLFNIFLSFTTLLIISALYLAIKVVPQSKVYVVERFGKYTKTLESGLSIIIPFVDRYLGKTTS